jgi:hypothetical protein
MYPRIPQRLSLSPFFPPTRLPALPRSAPTRGLRSLALPRSAAVDQAWAFLRQMGEGARRPALRVLSLEGSSAALFVPAARKGTPPSYTGLYRRRVPRYTRGMLRHLSHAPQIHPAQQERSWSLLYRSTSEHKSADMPSSVPTCGECDLESDYFCNSTTNFVVPGL